MASRRTKSISTKVTVEEYTRLAARAGEQTISEWARAVLLKAATPTPAETTLLAELLALRTLLLNLHFAALRGDALTTDAMQRLIDRADAEKCRQARERLAAVTETAS